MTERGQVRRNFSESRRAIVALAAVSVTGNRDQHLRFDLSEAIEGTATRKFRRAIGPNRSEARGGKKGNECLEPVWKITCHAVAAYHTEAAQRRSQLPHRHNQFGPSQNLPIFSHPRFRAEHD